MKFRTVICIAASLAVPAPAIGQDAAPPPVLSDKSLEELMSMEVASVTGAARHEQRVTEAPSSVTVVTAADIATFGWRTLTDVLRTVRGFYVTYDRNYAYLGVRGFGRPTDYNNRMLVLVDGHRLNDNVYDAVGIGTDYPIDLDLVERIEIIRGPGSALYGTSAFFGVVNVITRRAAAFGSADAAFEVGTLGLYRVRATGGWSSASGRDALFSVTHYSRRGDTLYFPEFAADSGGGVAVRLDGDEATTLFASGHTGRWSLQASYSTRGKHVPTASWGTAFGDPRFQTRDSRGWADAAYQRTVRDTAITARLYADYMGYSGTYPIELGGATNLDYASGTWVGGELAGSHMYRRRHRVTVGIEERANLRQAQRNADDTGLVYVDDVRRSQRGGMFVQDEVTLSHRLTATLGARWDWWTPQHSSVRPRLGLVYRTDRDLAIKLLYGEAFRAANVYELYYEEVGSRSNPDLTPERLQTTELVFEQYLAGRVRVTAAAFFTQIAQLIDQADTDAVYHVNRGRADARGVELEAEHRSGGGVLVRGSVVFERTIDADTNMVLSNAPRRLATLQVAVPVLSRQLTAALDTTMVGERTTFAGPPVSRYTLSSLTATWRPNQKRYFVQAAVRNLFDARYADPVGTEFVQPSIVQDGRTAGVKVGVRF